MLHNISSVYTSISPIALSKESFFDVIDLYIDIRKMQMRENKHSKKVIRKQAEDNWF